MRDCSAGVVVQVIEALILSTEIAAVLLFAWWNGWFKFEQVGEQEEAPKEEIQFFQYDPKGYWYATTASGSSANIEITYTYDAENNQLVPRKEVDPLGGYSGPRISQ